MKEIFSKARTCITSSLIEQLLHAHGSYWKNGEYWTLNPIRSDSKIGSFSINEKGLWNDFATSESGDLIGLVSTMRGCSKGQAAEEIVRLSGGQVKDHKMHEKSKANKIDARIPVPESALKGLNETINQKWVVEKHGNPSRGWTYRELEGGVAFAVVRFEKPDGSKDVMPWYYGVDSKWHPGQPIDHGRPLYKLDQIAKADKSIPILIVEGEKCASIDVQGYLVTTWSGGCSATQKTDWAPIDGREVVIWPDYDAPGEKAAHAIARRLPGAKVLKISGRSKGWDIADAVADGIDVVAFIADALKKAISVDSAKKDEGRPFVCLGYDDNKHWFMKKGMRMPFSITMGTFNQSKLLELGELDWWSVAGFVTDQNTIRVASAQDSICKTSRESGRYEPERIRGAGVWRDKDGMLVNDGRKLIKANGTVHAYDEYDSDYYYVSSSTSFGNMIGYESTDEDGKTLEQLFRSQGFATSAQAVLAMGWSLIAPFGGVLRWRPHIWVTGKKGSGKSWVLEDLIRPLCGPFAHKGSGKDSEAGIRRSLNMDARPVILDEMEPKGQRASEKVQSILDLARNASSDGSGYITIASPDGGTQRFVVRSCFCFGSIQTPDEGAAIASRISKLELLASKDQATKFKLSGELYAQCMADDPGRFTRRTFRALHRILTDIEWMRVSYLGVFGDQRKIDQIAPLLAAAWAAQSPTTIKDSQAGKDWLEQWIGDLAAPDDGSRDDEEAVIDHILAGHVKVDNGVRTIGELLEIGYCLPEGKQGWAQDILARYGIRVYSGGLAIVAKSDQLRGILRDTPYSIGYGAQIRRHRLCITDAPKQVRMAGQSRAQCYVLDWERFKYEYITEQTQASTPAIELSDEIPF